MEWAQKRRIIYGTILTVIILVVIGLPLYFLVHETPTCFDGTQNGMESGVDCGGVCSRICENEVAPLVQKWSRAFEITPGVYTAVAYVENPNVNAGVPSITYRFELFDNANNLIATREGETYLAPNDTTAVIETNIATGNQIPARTFFEFTEVPQWHRAENILPNISISRRALIDTETRPRLFATISNLSPVAEYEDIDVTAVIFGTDGNAISASRTIVPRLSPQQHSQLVFTWPLPFGKRLEQCSAPADIALLIDVSGSMNNEGINPPQPITDATEAARGFIERLNEEDRGGIITFATNASVVKQLSRDHEALASSVRAISIDPREEQGVTNIGAGLALAKNELSQIRFSEREKQLTARRVAILLTDGLANAPEDPGGEVYAQSIANELKDSGVTLYTIGLGGGVNETFLEALASKPSLYYQALSSDDLDYIYSIISDAICERGPSVIDINVRTLDAF